MKIITEAMTDEDVADGMSIPAQAKPACLVVIMTGSGQTCIQRRRLNSANNLQICHAIKGDLHDKMLVMK
jgi:3-deoxy-D-manno-octulosonate 8-phosphate phosphatase KdsC-like HAD superfamily phosphatase